MEAYRQAGLGGLELTPIYGVAGYEDRFVPYLSPPWMALLDHTLKEAARLGLGLDMATGTGWPFGGPWVDAADACKTMAFKTYRVNGGERLAEPVAMRQEPTRPIGGQSGLSALRRHPWRAGREGRRLARESPAPAGSTRHRHQRPRRPDLCQQEPPGARAGPGALSEADGTPGADGLRRRGHDPGPDRTGRPRRPARVDGAAGGVDALRGVPGLARQDGGAGCAGRRGQRHRSLLAEAIRSYLARFDQAFAGRDVRGVRAFFNDSYEVDDARGQADWTPRLFEEFAARRGYDLREHLPALFGKDTDDRNARVLTDYRQTVSDLLLDTFTTEWRAWAERHGAIVRNQPHGSPANILDLYAASDIPETEGTDLLRIKFASSAAHVAGRRLASSESATWLNDHFLSSLADVRRAVDRYFLGGINHIVYHGTAYSPAGRTVAGLALLRRRALPADEPVLGGLRRAERVHHPRAVLPADRRSRRGRAALLPHRRLLCGSREQPARALRRRGRR